MKQNIRNLNFDVIRVYAMIMVLLNHTIAGEVLNSNNSNIQHIIAAFSMVASRTGVPLFLMLSGALNLNRKSVITIKDLYFNKIKRKFKKSN